MKINKHVYFTQHFYFWGIASRKYIQRYIKQGIDQNINNIGNNLNIQSVGWVQSVRVMTKYYIPLKWHRTVQLIELFDDSIFKRNWYTRNCEHFTRHIPEG